MKTNSKLVRHYLHLVNESREREFDFFNIFKISPFKHCYSNVHVKQTNSYVVFVSSNL